MPERGAGRDVTGYMRPERKGMGMTRKFMMMLKPSKEVSRARIRMPMEVMAERDEDGHGNDLDELREVDLDAEEGDEDQDDDAWATEIKVPEIALPMTMERREMGATSISFMKRTHGPRRSRWMKRWTRRGWSSLSCRGDMN